MARTAGGVQPLKAARSARVTLPRDEAEADARVERLMGRKLEERFRFIQDNAEFVHDELDV